MNGAQIGDTGAEHVLPVVRTALLLVLAALPAILLGDRPGLELLRPFAASLVGGVVTSWQLRPRPVMPTAGLAARVDAGYRRSTEERHGEHDKRCDRPVADRAGWP